MKRTLAFVKNNAIATAMMVGIGAGVSEITSYFCENHKVISIFSTASQFLTGGPAFLYLHWKSSKEDYSGKKEFLWDYAKYSAVSLTVGSVYFLGRPFLQEYFLGAKVETAKSSILADFCALTGYLMLQIPIAKISGLIRNEKRKNLEEKLKKGGAF